MTYPLLGCYSAPPRSRLVSTVLCMPVAGAPRTVHYSDVSRFRTRRWLQISVLPQAATVAETPAAVSAFVAEAPEPDVSWNSPKVIMLFLTAGKAHITLTDAETGAFFNYTVTKAGAKYTRSDISFFVDVDFNQDAGGRINGTEEFLPRRSKVAQPATKLFADWYGTISLGRPARGISAKHRGKCGICARTLTDGASIARGIGPECYHRVFGVRRPVAKKVGAVRAVKAAKVIAEAGVDHMLAFNLGIHVDLEIAYEAALARTDGKPGHEPGQSPASPKSRLTILHAAGGTSSPAAHSSSRKPRQ